MATLRNKRKLTAVTRETQEENPRNGQSRNKKQITTHSETVPGTFRNTNAENQGTNEDDSQSDPHPEAGIFRGQTTQNFGPKDCPDMVTGVTGEICHCRDMVTGVRGEIRYRPDMVTGGSEEMRNGLDMATAVQEEIPYCSSGLSSGKQKKARSTSQPQFRSENTPATTEADQILLALQQLATNSNSANFNNNISRISKLPKSLTTTMPTFDGKSENFELFEDLFQTSLKIHNQLTEGDKVNYFHSLMRGDALQTFKNISSRSRENLTEILTVFRRKYVKLQSMAAGKHKFQQLIFNPANQNLIDFLEELQKLAKDAFGVPAQAIIDQFIYAKMPPHLKKSINQAHLESGTYEQIVTHIERELELNILEYPDETQMNTVPHKQQNEGNPDKVGNINSDTNDSNPNNHKIDRNSRTLYLPCETCGKTNHSTERCYVGANAANRPLPWKNKPQQDAQNSITGCVRATAQYLN